MWGVVVEEVAAYEPPDLTLLRRESAREAFGFVERAEAEWLIGTNRFDADGEAFFVVRDGATIVGMSGLNADPYADDPTVGRLRHLYVSSSARRRGIGRLLVESCLDHAQARFDRVRLRCDQTTAIRLYRSIGFQRVAESDATHSLDLTEWKRRVKAEPAG